MIYLITSLQVIATIITAFLLYYVQEKGKNIAQKQDLAELTEIVEDIKLKNNEELELLKSSLSVINHRQTQIFTEEKLAIIEFHLQLNAWLWDQLDLHLNEYNHTNYNELKERLKTMRSAYNSTQVKYGKIKLLISDMELIRSGGRIIESTLKLHHFQEMLIFRLLHHLTWEKVLIDQTLSNKEDFKKLTGELKNFYENKAIEIENERKKILEESINKRNEVYCKPVHENLANFEVLASKYLKA